MNIVKIPISNQQRGMIYGLARDLGIDNASLHDFALDWARVRSLKSDVCSSAQANIIIECLEKMKGSDKNIKRGTITDNQINAIKAIKRSYKWGDERLNGFILHTLGIDELESLESMNHKQASRVITGLKQMSYAKK